MSALPSDDTGFPQETHRPTRDNRVDRRNPCEWCEATKACLRFDDGSSFCRTVGDNRQWTDSFMGGYLHQASDQEAMPTTRPRPKAPAAEPANADTLHNVYSDLLARCPLSAEHRALLTGPQHGLADEQANRYGTLPADLERRRAVSRQVLGHCGTVATLGTPGFYVDDQQCQTVGYGGGILMPRRDLQGRITGFIVRSDKPAADPRYLWLSSASTGGPSCGSAAHIAQPAGGVQYPQTVYIVEGVKKADLVADHTGSLAISINGVGNVRAALAVLDDLATQGVDTVVIALDRDIKPTAVEAVERSRQVLAAGAVARGYAVRIAVWDPADGKGPDDLLAAGHGFTLERYCPSGGPAGHIFAAATDTDDEGPGLVTVDPRILHWMLTQVASTATLRSRYHHLLAIVKDRALNDGQKLAAVALSARLPVGHATGASALEPVIVSAATIAHDLGSEVATQKDGTRRPTKLNTVTKNLGDLINLGAFTREAVEVPRIVTVKDEDGRPIEREIITKTFKYQAAASLPGQRMKRDEARAASTRAKADRERPRCPRCFSARLRASAHVCLDCNHISSDVDAMRAAEALKGAFKDIGEGRYAHRETGEIIVPGVMVEDIGPDTGIQYQASNGDCDGPGEPIPDSGYFTTNVRSEGGYRIPVSDPSLVNTDLHGSVAEDLASRPARPEPPPKYCRGGCGAQVPSGFSYCLACRSRLHPPPLPIARTSSAASRMTPAAGGGAS